MGEVFFTSDTHFCHQPSFLWEPRGFNSVEEMNEELVERWNKVVKPEDEVYHLGDFALNDIDAAIPYINRLNGTIRWILGNHDTEKKISKIIEECPTVWEIGWAYQFKYNKKYSIYLSHYPTLTANFDTGKHFSQNVINLHGHIHSKNNWMIPTNPFIYHVGVDSHNCTPVHIDEILSDIRQRWNEIGKLPQNLKPEDTYPYEKNLF
jgi:calcineurin-like phosphoesterase family protein